MIRLIATDLDGTLLTSQWRIAPRTLQALERAAASGITVVPASGRQPFSIAHAVADTFLAEGWVVGSNGAIVTHLGTGEVLHEALVSVEAQTALYRGLRRLFPGLRGASVRDGGETFVPERGYTGLMDPGDHGRPPHLPESELAEMLGTPSLKLVVRDPAVTPEELLAAALDLDVPGVSVTTSGAPFLEVAAAGVSKALGLAALADRLGVEASEIVAFGDNRNDVEMLTWVGRGIAMGNARADLQALVGEVTFDHDNDGIAAVVERLEELRA